MKSAIPFLLMSLALASGCEKSITVDLPEQPRKLVLNAVILRGEAVRASVTRTLSNAESGKGVDASVAGAQILLYRDGLLADTLEPASPGEYGSDVSADAGHRYKLVISHPDYGTAEAESVSPAAVPVLGWSRDSMVRSRPDYGTEDLLRVRFRDPAESGDHYILQILDGYEQNNVPLDFYSWRNCISVADPAFESPYTSELPGDESCVPSLSLLLRDASFNGQEKELRMYASSYVLSPQIEWRMNDTTVRYASLRMYHVPAEFYSFVKSYRSAEDASGNPFAEPFNVKSNVRGGYGIFAIISEERVEIR